MRDPELSVMKSPVNLPLGRHWSALNMVVRETRCVLERPSVWCIVGRGLKRGRVTANLGRGDGLWN